MRLPPPATLMLGAVVGIHAQLTFDPPSQNFTQKLNHNSEDNTTFQQQYQLDTRHFKPGGPILFHQGEEHILFPQSVHVFSDYAPKLGAIIASLEHRYFGTSYPQGLSSASNITTEQYGPLTLENVLQDSVEFINFIRKTVPGAENSRVIHSGGSYGGFLSVLARIRYPETFYGSVAMSPVVASFGRSATLQENAYKYASSDWVANVYWDANAEAARKIRDALKELDTCAAANNCSSSIPDLNLCTQPTSQLDWFELESVITGQYALVPQFDFARQSTYPANPLALLINQTIQAKSSGEVLRLPVLLGIPSSNSTSCIDWAALSGTGVATQVGIGASWIYITCAYYIVAEGATSSSNSLFPPWLVDQPSNGCGVAEWAGPDFNATNEEWMAKFNFTDEALDQVTRLLITHGASDRTAAIGSPKLSLSSDRNHSRVVMALGVGHTEQSFPETAILRGVKPQLDILRDTQLAYIQEWLGLEATVGSGDSTSNSTSITSGPSPKPNSGARDQSMNLVYRVVFWIICTLFILV